MRARPVVQRTSHAYNHVTADVERLHALQIRVEDGLTVVRRIDFFDHNIAQQFAAEVICRVGVSLPEFVVLDLSETSGMLSVVVMELVSLAETIARANGCMVLSGVPPALHNALKNSGMEGSFMCRPDIPSAKEELLRQKEI